MAWHKVTCTSEIPDGEIRSFDVAAEVVAIADVGQAFFAIDDFCTHEDVSLGSGVLEGQEVLCQAHGARFDVTTGEVTSLPAFEPVATYELKVEGDDIYVALD